MNNLDSGIEANLNIYDHYYEKPNWWFRWRYDTQIKRKSCLFLLKKLRTNLSKKKIFELGFGSGDILLSFPKNCELYGGELSPSAIKMASARAAKKGYQKLKFFQVYQNKPLPLPDKSVDIAIASHVLEHVKNDAFCVREMYRILKLGGALVILIPINERHADPCHHHQYTFEKCKHLCTEIGFKFVDGLKNELLFYIVEKLYREYSQKTWGFWSNFKRIAFNLFTAPLPFWNYRIGDLLVSTITKLPPRQAAFLFIRESN